MLWTPINVLVEFHRIFEEQFKFAINAIDHLGVGRFGG